MGFIRTALGAGKADAKAGRGGGGVRGTQQPMGVKTGC